jgi:flagellar FliL protein
MAAQKEQAQKGSNNGSKLVWMLIPAVLLLVAGVGAGAYYVGAQATAAPNGEKQEQERPQKQNGSAPNKGEYLGPVVELKDFVVNIEGTQGTRYLKAGITLEADSEKTKKAVEARKPQIRDIILFHLGNKRFNEVRDLQGKKQLRAELVRKINSVLNTGKIRTLFFTGFVVQ